MHHNAVQCRAGHREQTCSPKGIQRLSVTYQLSQVGTGFTAPTVLTDNESGICVVKRSKYIKNAYITLSKMLYMY